MVDRDREDELAAQAEALGIDVRALAGVVAKLASRSTVAELAAHTVQRIRRLVVALAVLSVLCAVLLGYLFWTNARVTAVQERTSNEVLCPLYELFLRSYHPEAQPPERRADYEASFAVIRHSYAVLECATKPEG
jgi:hypothetical protein